jgi:hypothetical protein
MEYRKQVFERETLPAGAIVRDAQFIQCSFVNCWYVPSPEFAYIERTIFERTTLKSKRISNLVVRDVTVYTCKKNPMFIMWNCLYEHVTMRGEFGSWMFGTSMFSRDKEFLSPAQLEFSAKFYDTVDWALDIRAARFKSLTLRGVPGDKVRHDPRRQGLVRKDRLLADRSWESYEDRGLIAVLRATLDRPAESEILAASDFSKDFEAKVKRLEMLRNDGFIE